MFQKLIRTDDNGVATLLRLTLAIVMFPHGAQKALGWFGGGGWSGTVGFLGSLGIPAFVAVLIILGEFLGSLGLAVGFLSRVAAFGIAVIMAGAVFMVHLPNGFFMNWTGQQAGEGYEYHLLAIGIAIAVMIRGSGAYSVDRQMSR